MRPIVVFSPIYIVENLVSAIAARTSSCNIPDAIKEVRKGVNGVNLAVRWAKYIPCLDSSSDAYFGIKSTLYEVKNILLIPKIITDSSSLSKQKEPMRIATKCMSLVKTTLRVLKYFISKRILPFTKALPVINAIYYGTRFIQTSTALALTSKKIWDLSQKDTQGFTPKKWARTLIRLTDLVATCALSVIGLLLIFQVVTNPLATLVISTYFFAKSLDCWDPISYFKEETPPSFVEIESMDIEASDEYDLMASRSTF